jgi:hypothetical protein
MFESACCPKTAATGDVAKAERYAVAAELTVDIPTERVRVESPIDRSITGVVD